MIEISHGRIWQGALGRDALSHLRTILLVVPLVVVPVNDVVLVILVNDAILILFILLIIVLVLIILISMMIVRELCKSFKTPFPFHHASWNPICDQCKEPATGCKSILCWWQSPSFVSIPCLHPLLAFLCALHTLAPAGHSSLISAMIETMETSHPIQVIF